MKGRETPARPAVKLPAIPEPVNPEVIYLRGGVPLYLFPANSTEITRIEISFRAGLLAESIPLQARFTNLMLPSGTALLTAGEIDERFDYLGSFPNYNVDRDRASVQLYTLPSSFAEAAELLHDIIAGPVFPENELEIHRESRLQAHLVNRKRVSYVTLENFFEMMFGEEHPYGKRATPDHFSQLNRENLADFHRRCYLAGPEKVILSGNINDAIQTVTGRLFAQGTKGICESDQPVIPLHPAGERRRFIEMTGALQSSIRIGRSIPGMTHPDFPALRVTDTILGGYFGSRLMSNLREKKGFTYGIGSSVFSLMLSGVQMISTEVGAESTSPALKEIYSEIDRLRRIKVPASELRLVRSSMLGDLARQFDGPFAMTDSYLAALEAGMDMGYYRILEETIKSITPDEIKRIAETYYNRDDFFEVVAGRMQ